jgi:hypothetical protein
LAPSPAEGTLADDHATATTERLSIESLIGRDSALKFEFIQDSAVAVDEDAIDARLVGVSVGLGDSPCALTDVPQLFSILPRLLELAHLLVCVRAHLDGPSVRRFLAQRRGETLNRVFQIPGIHSQHPLAMKHYYVRAIDTPDRCEICFSPSSVILPSVSHSSIREGPR